MSSTHSHEQISPNTWKVVESDRFGQFPFVYVRLGADKCIVIDTGCGIGDIRAYISRHINRVGLPYLVINTHVHFDHVGGNHRFAGRGDCLGVCMGDANRTFSQNLALMSLAPAHGTTVQEFTVTRWLKDGELIYLDDGAKSARAALQVVFTPGHTLDSISLYDREDKRLFVGDMLYPWTAISLSAVGSSLKAYVASLERLKAFCADPDAGVDDSPAPPAEGGDAAGATDVVDLTGGESAAEGGAGGDAGADVGGDAGGDASAGAGVAGDESGGGSPAAAEEPSGGGEAGGDAAAARSSSPLPPSRNSELDEAVMTLLSFIGMDEASARLLFHPETLLSLCDGDVSQAVNLFMGMGSSIAEMAPPKPIDLSGALAVAAGEGGDGGGGDVVEETKTFEPPTTVRLSCGHVEANLEPGALDEMSTMLQFIRDGMLEPSQMLEEGTAEYSNSRFSVVLATDAKWE